MSHSASRTILIDMRASLGAPTGVGAVARGLARTLPARDAGSRYLLFSSSRTHRLTADGYAAGNVQVVDRRIPHRLLCTLWDKARFPGIERLAGRCDIVHSLEPLPLPTVRAKTVAMVHDLFFLAHPELTDPAQTEHLRRRIRTHLPRADHVVTGSEHVRQLAIAELRLDAARVSVVPYGLLPGQFVPSTTDERQELRSRLRLPPGFILVVGTIEPRKNQGALIRAFAKLREAKRHNGAKVILCGKRGHLHYTQEKAVADANITTEVRILDYLNDLEVKSLVSLARLVVVPSLDEGFSLPLIEAMAQGTPVCASRRGAIPEVAGDAALLFDPDDQEEMIEVLGRALNDDATRKSLVEKGLARASQFTWERSADRMLAVYEKLA